MATCLAAILSLSALTTGVAGDRAVDEAPLQLAQRAGDVHVGGYYRRDGTYVAPHWRSAPDGNPYNNYSFPGNVNPYTGKVAPGNPNTYLRDYGSGSSAPRRGSYLDLYDD
jgi:hypothetical protein